MPDDITNDEKHLTTIKLKHYENDENNYHNCNSSTIY